MILTHGSNSIGFGGGGGDIPPEYRDDYEQVQYIKNTGQAFSTFQNITFSYDDIIKLHHGFWQYENRSVPLVFAFEGTNGNGNPVNRFSINNHYSNSKFNIMWYCSDASQQLYTVGSNVPLNGLRNFSIEYPKAYMNDSIILNSDAATPRTANSVCLFGHDSTYKIGHSLGIVEILDKSTLERKYKFVPCKNKNTSKYGWLEIVTGVWNGNTTTYTDSLDEWTPPE